MKVIKKNTFLLLDRIHFWKPFNSVVTDKKVPIKYVLKDWVKILLYTYGAIKNEKYKEITISTPLVICASTLNQYYALEPLIKSTDGGATLFTDNPKFNTQLPEVNYYLRLSLRFIFDRIWFYYTLPSYEREVYRKRYYRYHIILGQYQHLYSNFKKNKKLRYYLAANDHSGTSQIGFVAARNVGLKTIYIQHAAISDLFPPLIVDYALLDGEDSKQKYLNAGPTAAKIFLVGTMKYDAYLRNEKLHQPGELVAICLGQVAHDINMNLMLCDQLEAQQIPFCVRFHPNIDNATREIFIQKGWQVSLPEEEPALDFIFRCHTVVAADSTILLESIILKRRPVYFVSDGTCRDYYGFLKREVVDKAYTSPEEIIAALSSPFDIDYHRRKAKWFCDSLYTDYEGYSTDRVLGILKKLEGVGI